MELKEYDAINWLFEMGLSKGDRIENIIATTFTLSKDFPLDLLGRAICCEKNLTYSQLTNNRDLISQYLIMDLKKRENSLLDRITIFCDDYILPAIGLPIKYNRMLDLFFIPETVCKIEMSNSAFFHPKLLILHCKKNDKDIIRFMVLSKNLTHGTNNVEVCARFESSAPDDADIQGKELKEFFDRFMCKTNDDENTGLLTGSIAKQRTQDTLDVLAKMSFRLVLPDGCARPDEVSLLFGAPDSVDCKMLKQFISDTDAAQNHYWCSDSIDTAFMEKNNYKHMISNRIRWASQKKCPEPIDNKIPGAYYFTDRKGQMDLETMSIHAKFAEFATRKSHIVWLGSANFTENGFNNNYECNVRIVYKKPYEIADPFFSFSRQKAIPDIKYEILPLTKDKLDSARNKDERIKALKKLTWKCTITKKGSKYTVEYSSEGDFDWDFISAKEQNAKKVGFKWFTLSVGKNIPLKVDPNPDSNPGNKPYSLCFKTTTTIPLDYIPRYGRGILIAITDYNTHTEIPVKIDLILPNSFNQVMYPSNKDNLKSEIVTALASGLSWDIMSIIPPEPNGSDILYDYNDDFSVRLAKYLAKEISSQCRIC